MERIDRKVAERLFKEADTLYREQRYADSLEILDHLDRFFPNQHRVLFPRARCLARLGQFSDALEVCRTLVDEHDYDKARPLLDQLSQHQSAPSTVEIEPYLESGFETPPPTDGRAFDSKIDLHSPPPIGISAIERKRSNPLVRLGLLPIFLLIVVAVAFWQGWIAWWLGAGIVAAGVVITFAAARFLMKLFEAPFRMKGAALHDASANVHEVRRCTPPIHDDSDEERREWYQIDVTISPTQNDEPFQNWEPGELALAPLGMVIRKPSDIDEVFQVAECRLVESQGEDGKVQGSSRVIVTVGLPPEMHHAQFAYYFETFGEVSLG